MKTSDAPLETADSHRITIALIDGDEPFARSLAERLEAKGFAVRIASRPETLGQALSPRPDLVVTDPDTSHTFFELQEYLNGDNAGGVIVVSARTERSERQRLFASGLLEYLEKDEPLPSVADTIARTIATIGRNGDFHLVYLSGDSGRAAELGRLMARHRYRLTPVSRPDDIALTGEKPAPDLLLIDDTADREPTALLDLLRDLRRRSEARTAIVLLRHDDDPFVSSRLYRAGADAILAEPCDPETLLREVQRHLAYRPVPDAVCSEQNLSDQLTMIINASSIVSKGDLEGNITYVNDQFCRISGYRRDELIGRPHSIIRHPENPPELFETMWNLLRTKQIYRGIVMNRRKDGTTYYVDSTIAPVLDASDTIVEYISIRHDVTPLIEKQHEIEDKRRKIQGVLDAQTSLICMVDNQEGIRQANKGFLDFLGISNLSPDLSRSLYLHELFLDIDHALQIRHGERYVWLDRLYEMRGKFVKVAMRDRFSNHHIFAIHVEKIPDPEFSEGVCYLVSFEDVTELNRALREAKEASEAESRFLATMSHEIRTPLNGILGFAELLRETTLDDEQRKYLQAIEYSGETLRQIINDILEVMKLDRETIELSNEPFNPVGEFESIVYPFYAQAKKKGIDFLVFIDPQLPLTVSGDLLRLKQILINLIGNAVKFTHPGHLVYVRIKRLSESEERIKIGLTVADEGIGVKDEHKARIFKPFVQADNSIAREYGGTGLGLNIVSRLVDAMGGTLAFKSEEGSGSVFHTALTLSSDLHVPPYRHTHPTICLYLPAPLPSKRFLLVERYLKRFWLSPRPLLERCRTLEAVEDRDDRSVMLFLDHIGTAEAARIVQSFRHARLYIVPSFHDDVPHMKLIAENVFWVDAELSRSNLSHILRIYDKPPFLPQSQKPATYFRQLKLLVAEDNEVNLLYIEELLKQLNIAFELAHDGYEAVKRFIAGRFDLVLMDINMPDLDGITAARQIRRFEEKTGAEPTPIIGLSADAIAKNIAAYLAEGLDGYLTKPLRKSDLVTLLEERFASRFSQPETTPPTVIPTLEKEQEMHYDDGLAERVANTIGLPMEIILELFRKYISNAESLMRQLEEDREFSELKTTLHSLKGISKNLYLEPLGTLCERFEKDLPSLSFESKREGVDALLREIRRTIEHMKRELNA